jgi:hypothetical protein
MYVNHRIFDWSFHEEFARITTVRQISDSCRISSVEDHSISSVRNHRISWVGDHSGGALFTAPAWRWSAPPMSISDPTDPSSATDRLPRRQPRYRRDLLSRREDGMGSRRLTAGLYEEIRRRLPKAVACTRSPERWAVRAIQCVRYAMAGSHPMHPSHRPIRCGCCN